MDTREIERRSRHEMRIRVGEMNYVHVVDGVGLMRCSSGTAAHDHHLLILSGRQQNAGGLVAHPAAHHSGHRSNVNWIVREIDDARIDLKAVVHAAAVEDDAAIGHQEYVRVERETRETAIEVKDMPVIGGGIVDLHRVVVRLGQVFSEAGGDQGAAVAQRDETGIPAAVGHRGNEGPLFRGEIEYAGIVASGKWIVMASAPRRQQSAVGKERVGTAEKVEGAVIRGKERLRVEEIAWRNCVRIPDDTCVDALDHITEIRCRETGGAATRTGKEEDFSLRKQRTVNSEHARMEWQNLPFAIAPRIDIQGDESVVAGILTRWIVDHHRDHTGRSLERGGRDAATLVFPSKPRGDAAPQTPLCNISIDVQVAADLVERLVLLERVIDLENEQIEVY